PTAKPTAKPTPKPPPKPTAVPTAVPTAAPTATPHQAQLPTDEPSTPAPSASVLPPGSPAGSASDAPNASMAPLPVVNPLRVESSAAADRGIFETVIASLLSFFLG
ncbi:MAG: hypothetical protein ACXWWU_05805, partial [Candidatus Limnocylindria bacterium]